jgi:general secretion pathway protein A
MYLDHYGFTKDPFNITPDPRFFYLSPSHREAYASMIYGLKKRKGFIAVIGEVGLGKTTVVRAFLQQKSQQSKLKALFIFNPSISFTGLLHFIFEELEIELPKNGERQTDDTAELVKILHRALIEEYTKGYTIVLVVDEAQNMPVETLENLRMLSNLETTRDKLLQIFLIGQPELKAKLNRPELRQLNQRLAIRSFLETLDRKETVNYIQHRLSKAGAKDKPIFTRRALKRIYKYSRGNPRLINILCDNALINGFGYGKTQIDAGIVKEVHRDLEGRSRGRRRLAWAGATVCLLALGVGLLYSPYGRAFIQDLKALQLSDRINFSSMLQPDSGPSGDRAELNGRERAGKSGNVARDRGSGELQARMPELENRSLQLEDLTAYARVRPDRADADFEEPGAASSAMQDSAASGSLEHADPIDPDELSREERIIFSELQRRVDVFSDLSPVRQMVLVNMAKQTSIRGLLTFDRMIAALEKEDYKEAAKQMVHSYWGSRVGLHAVRLAEIMYTGHPDGWTHEGN